MGKIAVANCTICSSVALKDNEGNYFCPSCLPVKKEEKPPLGLIPRKLHTEDRLKDIKNAVDGYFSRKMAIPLAWIDEYNEIIFFLTKENK